MQSHNVGSESYVIGDDVRIGDGVVFGSNTVIRATTCRIEEGVRIGSGNEFLVGDRLSIGPNTIIGDRNHITGRSIEIGTYGYWENDIEVGQGGAFGPNSRLSIGDYSMVCDRVILNLSEEIEIGSYVGIGNEVNVWTHGAFLPIAEGFPADFGPVRIGSKVWLPSRSIVLPGCTIGSNVVIGINSLVNREIPDGAFAAGSPIRIIEEDRYPETDWQKTSKAVAEAVEAYGDLAVYKELDVDVAFDATENVITCNGVVFDLGRMIVQGRLGPEEEDFRDYLRRRGIKFFTGKAFTSITPPNIRGLLDVDPD